MKLCTKPKHATTSALLPLASQYVSLGLYLLIPLHDLKGDNPYTGALLHNSANTGRWVHSVLVAGRE